MNLYHLSTTDASLNLAVEELLTREAAEDCFLLWRNAPSIIIGRHQNTAAEINEDFVRSRSIQVVRRMTGGGAVYHDLGNINFSLVLMEQSWGQESGAKYTAPVVEAIRSLGIMAEYAGRNDIVANGRKVSGCARSVLKEHTLFHGTLLFDAQLEILAQALRPDPEKILSKGIKSVRARVGNLREMLPQELAGMTMEQFISHLTASIGCFFGGLAFSPPPQEICDRAMRLADEKYRTWEWNYGTNLEYDMHRKIRFAGGSIQASLNIRENRIADLKFTGDFFGSHPIELLTEKLVGLTPRKTALLPCLNEIPLQDFIAGITPEELASLLSVSD